MKIVLEGQHKFDFLTEEIPRPSPRDPREQYWKGEDSLIRSILINSMKSQIDKPLLDTAAAKDIWDTTQKMYSRC